MGVFQQIWELKSIVAHTDFACLEKNPSCSVQYFLFSCAQEYIFNFSFSEEDKRFIAQNTKSEVGKFKNELISKIYQTRRPMAVQSTTYKIQNCHQAEQRKKRLRSILQKFVNKSRYFIILRSQIFHNSCLKCVKLSGGFCTDTSCRRGREQV